MIRNKGTLDQYRPAGFDGVFDWKELRIDADKLRRPIEAGGWHSQARDQRATP